MFGRKKISIGDHVKIQMDENDSRAAQYDGKEADVKDEIGKKPRVLKLYVIETGDHIYLDESEVKRM
jgi:hypothetical protein